MEEIEERNRAFLRSRYPDLAEQTVSRVSENLTYTEHPAPNLLYRGKPLHSAKNPEREALNLVRDIAIRSGTVVLFLGLGLGYQVRKFRELYGQAVRDATVIVVERSAEVFSMLVKHGDLSFLEGTHLFIGDTAVQVYDLIERLTALSFGGYRIVKLRGSHGLHRTYYDRIESFFRENFTGKIADLLTRFAFESLWVRNIIDNLPSLVGKQSLGGLKGALGGRPVLVVNAGPSVYGQLALIREVQTRVHVIAVDTALAPLLLTGTVPDFVVSLDAGFFNSIDFRRLYTGTGQAHTVAMSLVADLVVHPLILRHWPGNLFFTEVSSEEGASAQASRMPLLEQFRKIHPSIHGLSCGGSISTTAIELALFMGADPVFVTGLDLSYTDYKTHVNSTALFDELYRGAGRLNTLDASMIRSIVGRKRCFLPAIGAGPDEAQDPAPEPVLSDFVFAQYLRWIEGRSSYPGRVVNCTARGARIAGLHHRRLEDMIEEGGLPARKPTVDPGPAERLSRSQAQSYLKALEETITHALEDVKTRVDPSTLTDRYVLIGNLVAEAHRLYGGGNALYGHLRLLLDFLGSHVNRSRMRMRHTDGRSP